MAENIKTLRRRIRTVASTRKITRTMEMISTAKLRRVQQAMEAALPYASKIQELVAHLASSEAAASQPLFERRAGGRLTAVVVASDRGLCGGYNSSVLRSAAAYLREQEAQQGVAGQVDVFAVGKRSREYMKKRGYNVMASEIGWGGRVEVERANAVSERMVQSFLKGETDRIVLIYNSYVNSVQYKPIVTQFLPLAPEQLSEAEALAGEAENDQGGAERKGDGRRDDADGHVFHRETEYIFEPSAAALFEALLPRYVQTKVYSALLEAMTTEHLARRIAMNSATENCDELIRSLTLKANKARQAAITKEILEIVGGAEALKG